MFLIQPKLYELNMPRSNDQLPYLCLPKKKEQLPANISSFMNVKIRKVNVYKIYCTFIYIMHGSWATGHLIKYCTFVHIIHGPRIISNCVI